MDANISADDGGPLAHYLIADHERLGALLRRALVRPHVIDRESFADFRGGLLRHIGLEEKILLPAAQRARDGEPLPAAARLRLDHGALAALLVPTPTAAVVRALRAILTDHNAVEEGPEGVYAVCGRLISDEAAAVLDALRTAPPVHLAAHTDGPLVAAATRRALVRAGYALDDYETDDR